MKMSGRKPIGELLPRSALAGSRRAALAADRKTQRNDGARLPRCSQLRLRCQTNRSAFPSVIASPARREPERLPHGPLAGRNASRRGQSKQWTRTADSGQTTVYHFCPDCGSTVHYSGGNFPDVIAVPLGAFDDPYFSGPDYSVWEARKHEWVEILGEDVLHQD
jgi:hypothetical protein